MESSVCGMICGAIPAFVWRGRGTLHKVYVSLSCLWSQIWPQTAPGMKQKCHVWVGIFFFTLNLFEFLPCYKNLIFITRQVTVMSWATILFTFYYSRKLSVDWTVAISFCCVVLHAWCWTVSSASTHTSWRTLCLNNVNSFFSLCVLPTEYTICLDYQNHRKWGVIHTVT